MKNNSKKSLFIWILIFVAVFMASNFLGNNVKSGNEIIFSDFLNKVESGEISSVNIRGDNISGKFSDGREFYTLSTNYPDLVKELKEKNVEVKVVPVLSTSDKIFSGILGWLPFILLAGLWIYFMKGATKGAGNPFSFGKSKAKLL